MNNQTDFLHIDLEFYRGVKEIAAFLGMHPRTCQRLLGQGRIPAKRDTTGKRVLCNLDHYRNLRGQ